MKWLVSYLIQTDSFKKGALWSTVLAVGTKVTTLATNLGLAFFFGATKEVDVFFFCFSSLLLLPELVATLDLSVIVPEAIYCRQHSGEKASRALFNTCVTLYLLYGLLSVAAVFLAAEPILTTFSRFDTQTIEVYSNILQWFAPLVFLRIIVKVLCDILVSYRYFTIPMLALLFESAGGLLFMVCLHGRLGIKSLILGMVISSLISIPLLLLVMQKGLHWRFSLVRPQLSSKVYSDSAWALLSFLGTSLGAFLPYYLLSGFQPGVLSAISYAQRTAAVFSVIITGQLLNVVSVKLSEAHARIRAEELDNTFQATSRFLMFVLFPLGSVLCLYSRPLVSLLFHRGSFDLAAVNQTASYFGIFCLALPFVCLNSLVNRTLMATQNMVTQVGFSLFVNLLFVFGVFFMSFSFGPVGFPLGFLIAVCVGGISAGPVLARVVPSIKYSNALRSLFANLILNGAMVTLFLLIQGMSHAGLANDAFRFLFLVLYAVTLFFANHLFNLEPAIRGFASRLVARMTTSLRIST